MLPPESAGFSASFLELDMLFEPFLNRKSASHFLKEQGINIEASTLAKLASVGGGPVMRKFGRRVLYEPQALLTWISEKLTAPQRSTSDVINASQQGDR